MDSICAHSRRKIDDCGSGQGTRSMLPRASTRSWNESPTAVHSRSASCKDSASCALNISRRRPNSSITPRTVASLRATSFEATALSGVMTRCHRYRSLQAQRRQCVRQCRGFSAKFDADAVLGLDLIESEQQLDTRGIDARDGADVDRNRQRARKHFDEVSAYLFDVLDLEIRF